MGFADLFNFFGSRKSKVDLWRRYEKIHENTSGTMSTFYKARDRQTDDIVGLKVVDMAKAGPIAVSYTHLTLPTIYYV